MLDDDITHIKSDQDPRKPEDNPSYVILRKKGVQEFSDYRKKSNLETVDLSGVDFSEADLAKLDATGIDFSNTSFRHADLRGVNFRESNLEGASLRSAQISGAYFPDDLSADEIMMSVKYGTRMRIRKTDI